MTGERSPVARVHDLLRGGDPDPIVTPLAARFAARIQERDWDEFCYDATQLANGLRDLVDAVDLDGLAVTVPDVIVDEAPVLATGRHARAAIEATGRLRESLGERVALTAVLPSSASAEDLLSVGRDFLAAGAQILVIVGDRAAAPATFTTLANTARFHQALALATSAGLGLPTASVVPFAEPQSARGLALSDDIPREVDVDQLADWIDAVRSG